MAQKIQLTVTQKELIADQIYLVTFHLVNPPAISFRAGQNMMLMVAPGVNRTMSIASPPSSANDLVMVHDVSPMGPGSKWTVGLNVGDSATIVAPIGGALSFLSTPKKKVMVATGTGVAPFHAMIPDAGEKYQMALYWGLRYPKDIYWREDFDAMANHQQNFSWHMVLSKPDEAWNGLTGHVTEHVLETEKEKEKSEFYLCGNKAMIEEVRTELLQENVPKEQIKTELFF